MFGRKKARTSSGSPAHAVALHQDVTGRPAVSLDKVRAAGHVDLAKRAEQAGLSLARHGLAGIRAECKLLLDHSGSMRSAYTTGQVQTLAERALGFALQVDADGSVEVATFDRAARWTCEVTVANYRGIVGGEVYRPREMGTTNLAAALQLVLDEAPEATSPLYVLVITDGSPDSRPDAEAVLRNLSHYPVFVKILATTTAAKTWLDHLDDNLSGTLVDNIDAKYLTDPAALTDRQFADAMADEWGTWATAALQVGLLTR